MKHLSHHLREEFCELLELYVRHEPTSGEVEQLHALAGKLWNCADVMPRSYRDDVEELISFVESPAWKRRLTVAVAARHVRSHIASRLIDDS